METKWNRLSLLFPEFFEDFEQFKKNLGTLNGKVSFALKNYGFELFIPQLIPKFWENMEIRKRYIDEILNPNFMDVKSEVEDAMPNFEKLRAYVRTYARNGMGGVEGERLADHLDFNRLREKEVRLYDYFDLVGGKRPTDILLKLREIPKVILNTNLHGLRDLAEYVVSSRRESNSIKGDSITDCAQRALEIYSHLDELKELGMIFSKQ